MMPPPGTRRPEEAVLTGMAEELEARIDAVSLAHLNPGTRTFQRLNRAEYARAVRGILDIDVDVNRLVITGSWALNVDDRF